MLPMPQFHAVKRRGQMSLCTLAGKPENELSFRRGGAHSGRSSRREAQPGAGHARRSVLMGLRALHGQLGVPEISAFQAANPGVQPAMHTPQFVRELDPTQLQPWDR